MVSNYDEKTLRVELSEGKRHYNKQKKTSLFGSESPRTPKNKAYHNRYTNSRTETNSVEENILTQNEILRREREMQNKKNKNASEKRVTLQELESYDPWGKPGAGAANTNYAPDQNGNRAKWEYEQELRRMNDYKNSDDKSYPGFAPGFGCGNNRKDGRRKSDTSSNSDETKQNIYFPFGTPGGGAPMTDDRKKSQGATVTVHKNPTDDNESRQKLDDAQAYADHLEQELQRLKLKQMEDKYGSVNNNNDDTKQNKFDNNISTEYEDDALYREAENRARLRELERLKETYEQCDNKYENATINNERPNDYNQVSNNEFDQKNKEIPRVALQRNEPKRASSSTHNDYRQYSMEEYMNSRQQLVNPTQLKRTTLSGSEELTRNHNYNNGDGNHNFKLIDEDNIIKQQSNANSYNNPFQSDRHCSASKKTGTYSMNAPYATD